MRLYIRTAKETAAKYPDFKEDQTDDLVIEYGVTGYENTDEISIPLRSLAEALAPHLDALRQKKINESISPSPEHHNPHRLSHVGYWKREINDAIRYSNSHVFTKDEHDAIQIELSRAVEFVRARCESVQPRKHPVAEKEIKRVKEALTKAVRNHKHKPNPLQNGTTECRTCMRRIIYDIKSNTWKLWATS